MAEYIDKKHLDRKFQIDMMALRGGTIFDTRKVIDSLPTADVIERSKIDNALADMQSMLDQEVLNDNVISDVGQGIEIAMGLLKENIGE